MKPIVALHGLLDSPQGFLNLQEELPIIAPRIPQNRRTLDSRREWLIGWAEKEGLKDFYLLGHSLGGALAAYSSQALNPKSLLLLAPAGFGSVPMARILSGALKNPLQWSAPVLMRSSAIVRSTYRHLFSFGGEMPEYLQKEMQRDPQAILKRAEREMLIVASLDEQTFKNVKYRKPVFALWGEKDRLVPWSNSENLLDIFPQAKIERMPGIGHDLLREDPERVTEWIKDSLKAHAGRALEKPGK